MSRRERKQTEKEKAEAVKKAVAEALKNAGERNVAPPAMASAAANQATSSATKGDHTKWKDWVLVAVPTLGLIFAAIQLAEMRRATDVAVKGFELSKAALDATIGASRNDQRAWVGVESIVLEQPMAGSLLSATMRYTNVGKSPALRVQTRVVLAACGRPLSAEELLTILIGTGMNPEADQALFPGAGRFVGCSTKNALNSDDIQHFQNRSLAVYAIGIIKYEDVFGHKHTTRFSQLFNPNIPAFCLNDSHNDAD